MLLTTMKKVWTPLLLVVALSAVGCYYDKEELLYPGTTDATGCETTPATFNGDVLPLITTKCAIPGCHNESAAGGRTFQNYEQVSSAKEMIKMQVVIQKTMPPTGPLPPDELKKLQCWIDAGGFNN
jgi:hypothetical protein